MSRLSTLAFRGLTAADRELTLGPLNLFLGSPGAGKSSVLHAAAYLALGCIPSKGKSTAATGALIRKTGTSMTVTGVLDDGRTIQRSLHRETKRGATSLRGAAGASFCDEDSTPTEVESAITRLFGANGTEASEHLDLEELLRCSPAERASRISALLEASGIDSARAREMARGLILQRLRTQHPAEAHEVDGSELGGVRDSMRTMAIEVLRESDTMLATGTIGAALETARQKRLDSQRESREKVAARGEIEGSLLAMGTAAKSDLPALRTAHEALVGSIAEAERDLAEAKRAAQTREEAEAPLPALRAQVAETDRAATEAREALAGVAGAQAEADAIVDPPEIPAPSYVQPHPDLMSKADALEATATTIEDPPDTPPPPRLLPDEAILAQAQSAQDEADRLAAEAAAIAIPERPSLEPIRAQVTIAEERVREREGSPWREVEEVAAELKAINVDSGEDEARRTKAQSRLLRLASQHGGDLGEANAALELARGVLATAEEQDRARADEIAAATTRKEALQTAATEALGLSRSLQAGAQAEADKANENARASWKAEADAVRAKRRENEAKRARIREDAARIRASATEAAAAENGKRKNAHALAVSERHQICTKNAADRRAILDTAERVRVRARETQEAYDRAAADLASAEARLAGIASIAIDPTAAEAKVTELRARLPLIETQRKNAEASDALRKRMTLIAQEIEQADNIGAAWACAEWALDQVRRQDVQERSAGLVARIGEFLADAGRTETAFVRSDRKETAFGMVRDGQEISVETLSGAEYTLFVVAMVCAIQAIRAPELRIVPIEENDLGIGPEVDQLFKGCEAAAQRHGIQFLVASNLPLEPSDAWTVHRLEAPVKALEGVGA